MRSAAVLLASALVLAACSAEETGADDPRTAVDTYLAAMNDQDEPALTKVLNEAHRDQAASHLSDRGGSALAVESVDITQDFGPMFANAHVKGAHADGSRYDERIVVSKIDGRWYVALPGPIRVPPGGKPTSAVTR
ncbi:hypothetical protein LFM09_39295 [Lentzea alba]|uniref:hypothetical protein n=1 Tax=Lentzea alba TaxID=2714351 RepID=UPI0039BFE118